MKFLKAVVLIVFVSIFVGCASLVAGKLGMGKKELFRRFSEIDTVTVWVYFTDKGPFSFNSYRDTPTKVVSPRSLERRRKLYPRGPLLSFSDYPVYPAYVDMVSEKVIKIRHRSRWFNAVSITATVGQLIDLVEHDFVRKIELLKRYKPSRENSVTHSGEPLTLATQDPFYGSSFAQLELIGIPAVHKSGNHGEGILIGVFDTGFRDLTHEAFDSLKIVAAYDFVDNDSVVYVAEGDTTYGGHGMATLSVISGYKPGLLIGAAYGASFVLARTEDEFSETPLEEDNWVAAIEWADSIGIDIASISLGYLGYDEPFWDWTRSDMDGNTTLITRAADMAASKGMLILASAGNRHFAEFNTLGAPADGDSVLAVGAVNKVGQRVSFSSVGPTTDKPSRIKPDIMAQGVSVLATSIFSAPGSYRHVYRFMNGTSFSCPLAAGAAALVWSAYSQASNMEIAEALKMTASRTDSPDRFYGWGVINAEDAIQYLKNKYGSL